MSQGQRAPKAEGDASRLDAQVPLALPGPGRLARPETAAASGWQRWLPGLRILLGYQAAWAPNDVVAGLVMTTMLVPVGIAYAEASGVPGIYGLYATIVPLLAYAVFGPNPILVLGPDSALPAGILATVAPPPAGAAGARGTAAGRGLRARRSDPRHRSAAVGRRCRTRGHGRRSDGTCVGDRVRRRRGRTP